MKQKTDESLDRHARAARKSVEELDGDLGRARAALGWLYIKVLAVLIPVVAVAALIYYLTR